MKQIPKILCCGVAIWTLLTGNLAADTRDLAIKPNLDNETIFKVISVIDKNFKKLKNSEFVFGYKTDKNTYEVYKMSATKIMENNQIGYIKGYQYTLSDDYMKKGYCEQRSSSACEAMKVSYAKLSSTKSSVDSYYELLPYIYLRNHFSDKINFKVLQLSQISLNDLVHCQFEDCKSKHTIVELSNFIKRLSIDKKNFDNYDPREIYLNLDIGFPAIKYCDMTDGNCDYAIHLSVKSFDTKGEIKNIFIEMGPIP